MRKGIDVSYVQKGLSLKKAKEKGAEFVIIRAGISTRKDTEFEENVRKAEEADLPYGFYWFSRAFSTIEAKSEARACIKAVSKYSPVYPIFYDMEEGDQIEGLSNKERTDIITVFCEEIKAAGYIAGVYINPSWLESFVEKNRIVGRYDIWLAHWTEDPEKTTKYDYGQTIWQWGRFRVDSYDVDGDICYKDYHKEDNDGNEEKPVVDPEKMLPIGSIVKFSGGKQYGASNSDIGYPAKPGIVRISNRAKGTAHPYHVISEDRSGVYGWVNSDTLSPIGNDENEAPKYSAGEKILLKDAALYSAAGSKTPVSHISGKYYLYDGKNVNGYLRICPTLHNVGKTPVGLYVTGWIKASEIK